METPPTNSYVDLQIIDCNRQHSVQARSGNNTNPALFTNELGEGIELEVGDRVAVQGAYISEIGAGQDTIELKGKALQSEKTITYIKEDNKFPTSLSQTASPLITGFQDLKSSEVPETFIPSDNETKITCEYYLSANGDSGYMFLPRRFGFSEPNSALTGANDIKYYADNWLKNDSITNGRAWFEQIDDQFVSDDFMYIDTSEANDSTTGFFRLKNDGQRFTLMRAVDQTFNLRHTRFNEDGTTTNIAVPNGEKASHYKYKIYRNKVDIKVNAGFNSPENIGEEITSILKNAEPPKIFQQKIEGVIHDLTITYETPTFKPFLCASTGTIDKDRWREYARRSQSAVGANSQHFFDYKSNFYNVYCKRPEIREAGQNVNKTADTNIGWNLFSEVLEADRTTATIETEIPWENASLFAPLFKAQGLYPELFNNFNAQEIQPFFNGTKNSVDNMRFLHMSNRNVAEFNLVIGGDNMFTETAPAQTEQSLPLFFKYQPENADKETDGSSTSDLSYGFATKREVTLVGGAKEYFITLHPELIGGINAKLFTHSGVDKLVIYRSLGFDLSFNAYGSAYMIGFNGRLEYDFGQANVWGIGNKNKKIQEDPPEFVAPFQITGQNLRQNYVGANNPRFGYDTEESRFFFKDLHTPELTGQTDYGAGDTGTIAGTGDPPTGAYAFPLDNTTNANRVVYKINKRINEYVYSPDMRPYDRSFITKYAFPAPNASGTGGPYPDPTANPKDTARKISDMNRNITPWSIIDSPTGIFINDFGYTKEQFPNSLWGLLGWTYDSLQANGSPTNNRLQRVDNFNKEKLSIPTTNSDIVSSDTRDFIVNQFGAVYFTTQLPTPSMVGSDTTADGRTRRLQYTPPISQGTVSIGLTAPNLPRKMLKPYYCIRSDIIDKPHYLGGEDNEAKLSVVAVADKQYSGNDFIFSSESDYVFTITKKKKITSITTSIHDPNQSFASVNEDSAVIYKISKNTTNRLDIAAQVMAANEPKKK